MILGPFLQDYITYLISMYYLILYINTMQYKMTVVIQSCLPQLYWVCLTQCKGSYTKTVYHTSNICIILEVIVNATCPEMLLTSAMIYHRGASLSE